MNSLFKLMSSYSVSGRNCTMKTENVDLDPMRKSDRREWGQVRFGLSYCPKSVLQLTIQWMVATGAVVGDLVHSFTKFFFKYLLHI